MIKFTTIGQRKAKSTKNLIWFDLMLSLVLILYLLAHINPGCKSFKFFGHSSLVLEFSSLGVCIYILFWFLCFYLFFIHFLSWICGFISLFPPSSCCLILTFFLSLHFFIVSSLAANFGASLLQKPETRKGKPDSES